MPHNHCLFWFGRNHSLTEIHSNVLWPWNSSNFTVPNGQKSPIIYISTTSTATVKAAALLLAMEAVAEGLWSLAEQHEQRKEIGKAVKCLEAICQSPVSFLPIIEIKTRLLIATLLLKHSHNVNHAKAHLERSVYLSFSIACAFLIFCFICSILSFTSLAFSYYVLRSWGWEIIIWLFLLRATLNKWGYTSSNMKTVLSLCLYMAILRLNIS